MNFLCPKTISLFSNFLYLFFQWKIIAGWVFSTIFGLLAVFGLYNYARTGDISNVSRIIYALFGRNAYALSLAWVTFACATGYGG